MNVPCPSLVMACLAAGLAGGLPVVGLSASPGMETTFDDGAGAWAGTAGTTPFGVTGAWSFQDGTARLTFSNPGFPAPDAGSLTSTDPAFAGNFDVAGVNRIRFSFIAYDTLPPHGLVILEWAGSGAVFQQGFPVTATGVWHHFTASLSEDARDAWTAVEGSAEDYALARQSVDWITLRVHRNGMLGHTYAVDNIRIEGDPDAASLLPVGGNAFGAHWHGLEAGRNYQVESATEITGSWTSVETFIATNATHDLIITNEGPRGFWRVLSP